MRKRSTARERIAYHEASHAVVAWLHGVPIEFATVDPCETDSLSPELKAQGVYAGGKVRLADGRVTSDRIELRVLLAGGLGQNIFRRNHTIWLLDAFNDFIAITALKIPDAVIASETKFVRELLRENWHVVERVAEELLKQGNLSGSSVYELCQEVANASH